jgi:hypothetical protein
MYIPVLYNVHRMEPRGGGGVNQTRLPKVRVSYEESFSVQRTLDYVPKV